MDRRGRDASIPVASPRPPVDPVSHVSRTTRNSRIPPSHRGSPAFVLKTFPSEEAASEPYGFVLFADIFAERHPPARGEHKHREPGRRMCRVEVGFVSVLRKWMRIPGPPEMVSISEGCRPAMCVSCGGGPHPGVHRQNCVGAQDERGAARIQVSGIQLLLLSSHAVNKSMKKQVNQ